METIPGFSIPTRELSTEEATRDLTIERISDFEVDAGESFIDYVDGLVDHKAIAGFFMAKYPLDSIEFIKIINGKHCSLNSLNDIFGREEVGQNAMHQTFCDFINLTVNAKKRINEMLIIHREHYTKSE